MTLNCSCLKNHITKIAIIPTSEKTFKLNISERFLICLCSLLFKLPNLSVIKIQKKKTEGLLLKIKVCVHYFPVCIYLNF